MAYTTTSGFPNLAVRIPKPGAEAARLKEGDALEIEVVEGRVELRRASKVPTLASWSRRSLLRTAIPSFDGR